MKLHVYPRYICVFDINGTLDCGANPKCKFTLPTKKIFDYLKKRPDVWVGTWSGMYTWMQLQNITDIGVVPDFVMMKDEWESFKVSLEHIYKRPFDCEVICIGDEEEDQFFAEKYNMKFISPVEFYIQNQNEIENG